MTLRFQFSFIRSLSLALVLVVTAAALGQQDQPSAQKPTEADANAKAAIEKAAQAEAAKISDAIKKEIKAAWEARAKRLQSVKLTYETKHLDLADPRRLKALEAELADKKLPGVVPAPINDKPTEWTTRAELRLLGRKAYYALSGERMFSGRNVGRADYIAAFDGTVDVLFSLPGTESKQTIAMLNQRDHCDTVTNLRTTGFLLWTVAPFDPKMNPTDLESRDATAERIVVSGKDLVQLKRPVAGTTATLIIYHLDPTQDYAITRKTRETVLPDGRHALHSDGQCEYQKHEGIGWFPQRWTFTQFNTKVIPRSHEESKIIKVEFNPKLTEKDFQIEYPIGTRIQDMRPGPPNWLLYIVMPDGKRKVSGEAEIAAAYAELEKLQKGPNSPPKK